MNTIILLLSGAATILLFYLFYLFFRIYRGIRSENNNIKNMILTEQKSREVIIQDTLRVKTQNELLARVLSVQKRALVLQNSLEQAPSLSIQDNRRLDDILSSLSYTLEKAFHEEDNRELEKIVYALEQKICAFEAFHESHYPILDNASLVSHDMSYN